MQPSRALITLLLWIPPAIQATGCLGLALFGSRLAPGMQTRSRSAGATELLIGLLLVALHLGYFLAPLWWGTPRRFWAASAMAPIALIVVGSLLALLGGEAMASGPGHAAGQRTTA